MATFVHPVPGAIRTARFGDAGPRWTNEHTGVDYAAVLGTPVLASGAGTVVFANWRNDAYGNMVEIDHGSNVKSRYAHLSRFSVKAGQLVGQRDQVGLMGSTGNATGTHLHFEILLNGRQVDPEPLLGVTSPLLEQNVLPGLLDVGQLESFFGRTGMFVGGVVILLLAIFLTIKERR